MVNSQANTLNVYMCVHQMRWQVEDYATQKLSVKKTIHMYNNIHLRDQTLQTGAVSTIRKRCVTEIFLDFGAQLQFFMFLKDFKKEAKPLMTHSLSDVQCHPDVLAPSVHNRLSL